MNIKQIIRDKSPPRDTQRCLHCDKKMAKNNMKYICEHGHKTPVHKQCRHVFVYCFCGKKIIASSNKEEAFKNSRRTYRLLFTKTLKQEVFGDDCDKADKLLVKRGVASSYTDKYYNNCYYRLPQISQEEYELQKKEVNKKLNENWRNAKQTIDDWFKPEKKNK